MRKKEQACCQRAEESRVKIHRRDMLRVLLMMVDTLLVADGNRSHHKWLAGTEVAYGGVSETTCENKQETYGG